VYRLEKTYGIASAHHLRDYEGPCARHHGHNYEFRVIIHSPSLNSTGMIIDFSEIKKILKRWDHQNLNDFPEFSEGRLNPTAENIASVACFLIALACVVSHRWDVRVEVQVAESQNNVAVFASDALCLEDSLSHWSEATCEGVCQAGVDLGFFNYPPEREHPETDALKQFQLARKMSQGMSI